MEFLQVFLSGENLFSKKERRQSCLRQEQRNANIGRTRMRGNKKNRPAGDKCRGRQPAGRKASLSCKYGRVAKRKTLPIWDRLPQQDCGFESRRAHFQGSDLS